MRISLWTLRDMSTDVFPRLEITLLDTFLCLQSRPQSALVTGERFSPRTAKAPANSFAAQFEYLRRALLHLKSTFLLRIKLARVNLPVSWSQHSAYVYHTISFSRAINVPRTHQNSNNYFLWPIRPAVTRRLPPISSEISHARGARNRNWLASRTNEPLNWVRTERQTAGTRLTNIVSEKLELNLPHTSRLVHFSLPLRLLLLAVGFLEKICSFNLFLNLEQRDPIQIAQTVFITAVLGAERSHLHGGDDAVCVYVRRFEYEQAGKLLIYSLFV